MLQRQIDIFMKIPSISQAFGIYTSSYDAGRVGDSGATKFVFNRPVDYNTNNLRLILRIGYNDPIIVNLGLSNEFVLTSNLTIATSFVMQVAFTDNDNIITISNKLTFYLTSSVTPDSEVIVPNYLQELLQFAISQKQNQMTILEDISEENPDDTVYKLVAFNHSGDIISEVILPISAHPSSANVTYDNTLITNNFISADFVQGAIDAVVQKFNKIKFGSFIIFEDDLQSTFSIYFEFPFHEILNNSISGGYWAVVSDAGRSEIVSLSVNILSSVSTEIIKGSNLRVEIYDSDNPDELHVLFNSEINNISNYSGYTLGNLILKEE